MRVATESIDVARVSRTQWTTHSVYENVRGRGSKLYVRIRS